MAEVVIPLIYLLISVGYIFLAIGFFSRKPILLLFSSTFLLILSINIFINGLDGFNNIISVTFGSVTFAIGSYVSLRSGVEMME